MNTKYVSSRKIEKSPYYFHIDHFIAEGIDFLWIEDKITGERRWHKIMYRRKISLWFYRRLWDLYWWSPEGLDRVPMFFLRLLYKAK